MAEKTLGRDFSELKLVKVGLQLQPYRKQITFLRP